VQLSADASLKPPLRFNCSCWFPAMCCCAGSCAALKCAGSTLRTMLLDLISCLITAKLCSSSGRQAEGRAQGMLSTDRSLT
jgi:hypothetical protein